MKFLILLVVIVIAFSFIASTVQAMSVQEACDNGTWWECVVAVWVENLYNGIDLDEAFDEAGM